MDEYKELIEEWFGDCTTVQEIAKVYAELLCEIRNQMKFRIESLKNKE